MDHGECGAGIKSGEGISFNVGYDSRVVSVHEEMKNLAETLFWQQGRSST